MLRRKNCNVNLDSSLKEIADEIASLWLLLPFPSKILHSMLDYSEIEKKPRLTNSPERPIHGFQNACRVAALIELFYKLYKKYAASFPPELNAELKQLTELDIKKLQIVGLMRSTGRTRDNDSGAEFSKQGKIECAFYLQILGVEKQEAERLANIIIDSDLTSSKVRMPLKTALLADATMLETIRDGRAYDVKQIPLSIFQFYRNLNVPRDLKPVEDFINICRLHAAVIAKHSGYLRSAITRANGLPISHIWPITPPGINIDINIMLQSQYKLEQDRMCFSLCSAAVMNELDQLNDNQPNLESNQNVIARFFAYLNTNQIFWNEKDNAAYIAWIIQFIYENHGTLMNVNNTHVYEFDWAYLQQILEYHLGSSYHDYFRNIETHLISVFDEDERCIYHLYSDPVIAKKDQEFLRLLSLHNRDFSINKNKIIRKQYGEFNFYAIKLTGFQRYYLNIQADSYCSLQMIKDRHPDLLARFPEIMVESKAGGIRSGEHTSYKLLTNRLVKILRFDDLCFVENFVNGITASPAHPDKSSVRHGRHKKFLATSQGVIERSKKVSNYPKELPVPKSFFSKHQSTTLVCDKAEPAVFSHDPKRDKMAGFIFNADRMLINRPFVSNIMSVKRPYESNTRTKLDVFYKAHFHNKQYFNPHLDLDRFIEVIAPLKTNNEVMACLRWIAGETAAAIFSDTFEARCIAMMYAERIKKKLIERYRTGALEGCWVDGDYIPIIFYLPGNILLHLKEFTSKQQAETSKQADKIFNDVESCYTTLCEGNFEFLMWVKNPAAALNAFFKLRPILFHLFENGLFHIADFLFARSNLPGTLCQYIQHQMVDPRVTGYFSSNINEKMLMFAASSGRLDILHLLLEISPSLINSMVNGKSLLYYATFYGHGEIVEYLLSKSADVNALSTEPPAYPKHGRTALYWAVKFGYHEIAQLLLAKGAADECLTQKKNRHLIHIAVINDDLAMLKLLLNAHPEFIDLVDENGRCALEYALARQYKATAIILYLTQPPVGKLPAKVYLNYASRDGIDDRVSVSRLLTIYPDLLNYADEKGTSLFYAAFAGNLPMIQYLVSLQGIRIDQTALGYNVTPLAAACRAGHVAVAGVLLDHGANPNSILEGKALLIAMLNDKKYDPIELLISHPAESTPYADILPYYSHALEEDDVRLFRILVVKYPLLIELKDDDREYKLRNKLIQLAKSEKLNILSLLLVMHQSKTSWHIIHCILAKAALSGYLSALKLILQIHPHLLNAQPIIATPLTYAAAGNNIAVVKYLLKLKADINLLSNSQMITPIDIAAAIGHLEVVNLLIAHKAQITLQTVRKAKNLCVPALWRASDLFLNFTHIDFLNILRERKIRFTAKSSTRITHPLHIAAQARDLILVQMYVGESEEITMVDKNNKKPQDLGCAIEIDLFCYINKLNKRKTDYGKQINLFNRHIIDIKTGIPKSIKLLAANVLVDFIMTINLQADESLRLAATTNLLPHIDALQDSNLGKIFKRLGATEPYHPYLAKLELQLRHKK